MCSSSYLCGNKSSPKRKQGAGRDISNLAPKLALRTCLLQGLGPVWDGISVPVALEWLFLLAQPGVTAPLSHPRAGHGMDMVLCWPVQLQGSSQDMLWPCSWPRTTLSAWLLSGYLGSRFQDEL